MQLTVSRLVAVGDAEIGTLSIGNEFTCFTLEDVVRGKKVYGKTAIPAGSYTVILTESPRFSSSYARKGLGRVVPLLVGVPGFEGVRIHVGNAAEHTHGCLLVGESWDRKSPKIGGSVAAFKRLMKILAEARDGLRITLINHIGPIQEKLQHPTKVLFQGLNPHSALSKPLTHQREPLLKSTSTNPLVKARDQALN